MYRRGTYFHRIEDSVPAAQTVSTNQRNERYGDGEAGEIGFRELFVFSLGAFAPLRHQGAKVRIGGGVITN